MIKALAIAASLALLGSPVLAEQTHVMVRAQAQDAKFIGDQMGGVQVTLRDARTGRILAKGLIRGGTGDTPRIVGAPKSRYAQLADGKTAGFEAVMDLAQPTLVRIEATGPLGKPASSISASTSLWVVPGRDILGDGVVLTFTGLVVEPTATVEGDGRLHLLAKVSPMCGCPIDAGGLWDAANYTVRATLFRGKMTVAESTLAFSGRTGEYAGALPKPAPGRYTVRFIATDTKTPNAGAVAQAIDVGR